jgi:putative flippase GtrA
VKRLRLPVSPKQLLRFAFTGALVAVLYFAVLTGLVVLADAPAQVALVVAFVTAVVVHFTLNRQFVFGSETTYALHLTAQGVRYLGVAFASYLVNAVALATLPDLTGLPELLVVAVTTAAVTVFTFVALRGWVFRTSPDSTDLAARLSSGSQ